MLSDRDYMRTDPSAPTPPRPLSATTVLLIVNVAVFLLQAILYGYPPRFGQGLPLALRADQLIHGYLWQLFTFQFLHGGMLHLLLNCWGIFMFGRDVEQAVGKRTYLLLYFLSGAVGGLFQVAVSLSWHGHFGNAVVGASAGLFGLIAAFATMFPQRILTMLLFFVIPVSLSAHALLLISGGIAVFGILFPGDNVAHAAHLGGMLAGMFFVRQLRKKWGFWPGEQPRPRKWNVKRWFVRRGSFGDSDPAAGDVIDVEEAATDGILASEVDSILDKINAKGIQSLTERERRTLEEARKRMGGR